MDEWGEGEEDWRPSRPVLPERVEVRPLEGEALEKRQRELQAYRKRFATEQSLRGAFLVRCRKKGINPSSVSGIEAYPPALVAVRVERMEEVTRLFAPLFLIGKQTGAIDPTKLRETVEVATVGLMSSVTSTADFCKLVEILDRLHGWKSTPKTSKDSVSESDADAITKALGKKDR